jgi:hypothetical protein
VTCESTTFTINILSNVREEGVNMFTVSPSIETTDKPVKHRVRQGSMLGPLFLLLYINDLPETVSAM